VLLNDHLKGQTGSLKVLDFFCPVCGNPDVKLAGKAVLMIINALVNIQVNYMKRKTRFFFYYCFPKFCWKLYEKRLEFSC
jgi:hypothetical protein